MSIVKLPDYANLIGMCPRFDVTLQVKLYVCLFFDMSQVNKQIVSLLFVGQLLELICIRFYCFSLKWTLERPVEYCGTDTGPDLETLVLVEH